jgi:hypothetical protein
MAKGYAGLSLGRQRSEMAQPHQAREGIGERGNRTVSDWEIFARSCSDSGRHRRCLPHHRFHDPIHEMKISERLPCELTSRPGAARHEPMASKPERGFA